jgi:hypothetical protein
MVGETSWLENINLADKYPTTVMANGDYLITRMIGRGQAIGRAPNN